MKKDNFIEKYKGVRDNYKSIYNYKFKIVFTLVIAIAVVISVKFNFDYRISVVIGAVIGVFFPKVWKILIVSHNWTPGAVIVAPLKRGLSAKLTGELQHKLT